MKKIHSFAVAVIFALSLFGALCGCGGKNDFSFPATAEEEYARAYSSAGGKAYDFGSLDAFSARQTLTLYIPELAELKDNAGKAVYPVTESRVYWWDARNRDGIKSQVTDTVVRYNTSSFDKNTLPQYETVRKVYGDNKLSSPRLDHLGNQTNDKVYPIESFSKYADYMISNNSFDAEMQNIIAYPIGMFAELGGEASEDGKSFVIAATVNPDCHEDFFDIFAEQYSFVNWYTQAAGGDRDSRVYEHFIDPRFLSSVSLEIVTTESGIESVTATLRAYAASPSPLYGVQSVTVAATTEYSTSKSSIGSIKVPEYLEVAY